MDTDGNNRLTPIVVRLPTWHDIAEQQGGIGCLKVSEGCGHGPRL